MESMSKGKILRVYTSSTDVFNHESVYETIAFLAKKEGLAGATVFKGAMGYGMSSNLHSDKCWELINKVPVVVEIIDEDAKIDKFLEVLLPLLKSMSKGCLVSCQDTLVVLEKKGDKKKGDKK